MTELTQQQICGVALAHAMAYRIIADTESAETAANYGMEKWNTLEQFVWTYLPNSYKVERGDDAYALRTVYTCSMPDGEEIRFIFDGVDRLPHYGRKYPVRIEMSEALAQSAYAEHLKAAASLKSGVSI